jgi:hypothetical protein
MDTKLFIHSAYFTGGNLDFNRYQHVTKVMGFGLGFGIGIVGKGIIFCFCFFGKRKFHIIYFILTFMKDINLK